MGNGVTRHDTHNHHKRHRYARAQRQPHMGGGRPKADPEKRRHQGPVRQSEHTGETTRPSTNGRRVLAEPPDPGIEDHHTGRVRARLVQCRNDESHRPPERLDRSRPDRPRGGFSRAQDTVRMARRRP